MTHPEEATPELSITQAAKIHQVTRQAIYQAIRSDRLKARRAKYRWKIELEDLQKYKETLYSRAKSRHNGELIFDREKGTYSVNQVAKMLNVSPQKIYYATRVGQMKAARKGSAWVIHIDDIMAFQKRYLKTA